jgi:hypothetical protein
VEIVLKEIKSALSEDAEWVRLEVKGDHGETLEIAMPLLNFLGIAKDLNSEAAELAKRLEF